MNIIDSNNLIPDKGVIEKIGREHPFSKNLQESINHLTIKLSTGTSEHIDFDMANRNATLHIFPETPHKVHYEYILFHEFAHVADRLNPDFGYTDDKMKELNNNEKRRLTEIWNCHIDARLNAKGLYHLGEKRELILSLICGKVQALPYTVEGRLEGRVCSLKSLGSKNAEEIIRTTWNNPGIIISYDDLIRIAKTDKIEGLVVEVRIT